MRETNGGSMGESLMLFVAGAAIGGLLVALNTPKTGPELREDLKGMGRRAKGKAEDLAQDAEGAWEKLKGKAGEAASKIMETNLLPAICGRVCPQEHHCEGACVLGRKFSPVAVGMLEKFSADTARRQKEKTTPAYRPLLSDEDWLREAGADAAGAEGAE